MRIYHYYCLHTMPWIYNGRYPQKNSHIPEASEYASYDDGQYIPKANVFADWGLYMARLGWHFSNFFNMMSLGIHMLPNRDTENNDIFKFIQTVIFMPALIYIALAVAFETATFAVASGAIDTVWNGVSYIAQAFVDAVVGLAYIIGNGISSVWNAITARVQRLFGREPAASNQSAEHIGAVSDPMNSHGLQSTEVMDAIPVNLDINMHAYKAYKEEQFNNDKDAKQHSSDVPTTKQNSDRRSYCSVM